MGAMLMILVGWGDFRNSMADDFPDADLDAILKIIKIKKSILPLKNTKIITAKLEMMAHILFEPTR
ncbi:MAG: hypothetical protein CM15mP71_3630 [Candidatus Poseidoniales archaeon]|nr:MAG: hypothetical protein CM15mP71_3630 [Candidatus Poseidoniales archaeon]